jgi:hypothetical protein
VAFLHQRSVGKNSIPDDLAFDLELVNRDHQKRRAHNCEEQSEPEEK